MPILMLPMIMLITTITPITLLMAILTTVFMTATPQIAFADLSYKDLKGLHEWIQPEFQAYSPLYGYIHLNSETLRNYRFLGNYGEIHPSHGCMDDVPDYRDGFQTNEGVHVRGLIERKDCPHDFTSELIQRLFPAVDGRNLTENSQPNDVFSHLTPALIGKVLARIAQVKDQDLQKPEIAGPLEEALSALLFEGIDPELYQLTRSKAANVQRRKEMSALNLSMHKIKEALKDPACETETREAYSSQLKKLEEDFAAIRAQLSKSSLSSNPPEPRKPQSVRSWKPDKFKSMAHLIVQAVQESRKLGTVYPEYLPEQMLLAFMLRKVSSKEELLPFYEGASKILKGEEKNPLLHDASARQSFLESHWTEAEQTQLSEQSMDPLQAAEIFKVNPEAMVIEVNRRKEASSPVPPLITYKVFNSHSKVQDKIRFGDCGETLVRAVLNLALYHPETGKFDLTRLEELSRAHPELRWNKNLVDFYTRNPDASKARQESTHRDWNENVLFGLPNVKYSQGGKSETTGVCDMSVGVDNWIQVMDQLLFSPHSQGSSDSPSSPGLPDAPSPPSGPSPKRLSDPALTRAQKVDLIFSLLSRPDFQLVWSVAGKRVLPRQISEDLLNKPESDTQIALDIRMGSHPKKAAASPVIMKLTFTSAHFAAEDLSKANNPWLTSVIHELIKPDSLRAHPDLSYAFPLLGNTLRTLSKIPQDLKTPDLTMKLIMATPMKTRPNLLEVFKSIALLQPAETTGKPLHPLALRIKNMLGTRDMGTVIELARAEYAGHYPFGHPTHAIGKPEVKYHPWDPSAATAKWGEAGALHLIRTGELWLDVKRRLVWTDVLKAKDGTPMEMNLHDAKRACLDLNPDTPDPTHPGKTVRDVTTQIYDERQDALNGIAWAHWDRLHSPGHKKANEIIYQDPKYHPMPGCYLPTQEEYLLLEEDFRAPGGLYVPQIIPNLILPRPNEDPSFWTSTLNPDPRDRDTTTIFRSASNQIDSIKNTKLCFVRCLCSEEAFNQ